MLRRPLRNLGWLLGSRGINAAFSLIYLALSTRTLGLADFGRFALIVVMAQAVAGMASFSAWQAVVHWGAAAGRREAAAGFAAALDLASVLGGSVLAAAVAWSAPLWLPLPPDLRWTALCLCLAALCAIRSTPTGMLRLHDRYDLATAAEAVLPAIRAAGAVLAALAFPTIGGYVAAWGVAELFCAAAYWRFASQLQPMRMADVSLTRLPRDEPGAWRFVWATSLSRSVAVTSKQVVVLLVGAIGGPAVAGGFRVASQLGLALVQLGEAVSRALYPELVRSRDHAPGLAAKVAGIAFGAGLAAVTVAAVAGEWIVAAVAGPRFAFAHGAMVLLALAGTAELIAASADALLVAHRQALRAFLLRAGPLAAALLALPFAVRAFGLAGAASCMLLASAGGAAGLTYMAFGRGVRR